MGQQAFPWIFELYQGKKDDENFKPLVTYIPTKEDRFSVLTWSICIGESEWESCSYVEVVADGFPEDTSWEIKPAGLTSYKDIIAAGSAVNVNGELCKQGEKCMSGCIGNLLQEDHCYDLIIKDSNDDGMCCIENHKGSIRVITDGKVLATYAPQKPEPFKKEKVPTAWPLV
eukprot:TRINITY_DN547_c0_g1_i1.p1 TRINITY_DN547_c0_g1~~TRINITY_DN547_c0_g1_i1.p1  ORF type:complete len:172 (+),score=26.05 TRINITY_DN547_c0_g1_i1:117-632(+)